MKKFTTFIFFTLLILVFSSCKKDDYERDNIDNDYLIFGHFYGQCTGEACIETYILIDGKLYEDLEDNFEKENHYNFIQLNNQKYKEVSSLINSFPKQLLNDKRSVFGCPDCNGQGGLYIAYKKNGVLNRWKIDNSIKTTPTYLHQFINDVNTKINFLSK